MILVDTSIWIDHFRHGPDPDLLTLLAGGTAGMHIFVIGEIMMGSLNNRQARLEQLRDLAYVPRASDVEVATLVEAVGLHGTGLSYIDAHLLAAAKASDEAAPVRIWTRDKRLRAQAERLGIAYAP